MRIRVAVLLAIACLLAGALSAHGQDSDSALQHQWGLAQIGAPQAWARATGAGVRIGIVDSGIDLNHVDLSGKVVAHARCIDTSGRPEECGGSAQDDHGHGTHVAGIAAARRGGGAVAGVAPDAELVVAKIVSSDGRIREDDIVAGVEWVLSKGAKVVNLSLGDAGIIGSGLFCNNTGFRSLLNRIWNRGAIPVFAAGNCGGGLAGGGANFSDTNALVVGATNLQGERTSYTNDLYSAKWGLVAPGGDHGGSGCSPTPSSTNPCILSTYWDPSRKVAQNAYGYLAGTSMAAPMVAGAAAALLSAGLSRDAALTTMMANLAKAPDCGAGCQGRLDLAKAMAAVPAGGGGGGAGTTTPPTPGGSTGTTRRPSGPRPTTPGTASTVSGETTTTTDAAGDELGLLDGDFGDDSEASNAPSGEGRPDEQDDRPPAGPTAVALLGLLGVGGVGLPLVWRRFRPFG